MAGRVLISGAGIAGCCLAWWLEKYGYEVLLIEQAAEPRRGGYVIDFWGSGYDVAERMGLLSELRRHDLDIRDFRVVDADGQRISGINQTALQELTSGRVLSLPRSAGALALYHSIKDKITVRFGDSVTDIQDGTEGIDVRFREGKSDRFDLVFGADGLHSAVRRVVFGEEAQFERFLGYYVAAFSAPHYPHLDLHTYVTYGRPGRQIWRVTVNEDMAVFLLIFAHADPIPMHDPAQQKATLTHVFASAGWEAKEVLADVETADDFYFDRVSQIVMPYWTKGRVALLGDACACPSLLAGEGSSMAMGEAYTLAGELLAARGDHERGFRAYEQRLRPYVERKQKSARSFATSAVPKTALGLWIRNASLGVATSFGLTRLLFRAQLRDSVELVNYHY
jgi:2-polyprenyl-6-methoxyphenol hydroxylase-like FAD-dependent oxidoreductase